MGDAATAVPGQLGKLAPQTIVIGLMILALAVLYKWWWGRGIGNARPIPGPRQWAMPILGNLPQLLFLLRHQPLHQALAELSKRYGELMEIRLGAQRIVVASSPDAARLILKTHDSVFSGRAPNVATSILFGSPSSDIGFSDAGPQWKAMRRVCIEHVLAPKPLLAFTPLICEEVHALLLSIRDYTARSPDNRIVIRDALQRCSNNIISRMILGTKAYGTIGDSADSLIDLVCEAVECVGKINISDIVPWLAWLDLQGCGRRMRAVSSKLRGCYKAMIRERRESLTCNRASPDANLLNILLSAEDQGFEMSDEIIVGTLQDMFSGGTETSTIPIEWALAELLANPEKMAELRAEIDAEVGEARLVKVADLPRLRYLHAVVKETLRKHPVLPLLLPHRCTSDCELLGYQVQANTQVFINVWAIGHNPDIWDNPHTFRPERFLEKSTTTITTTIASASDTVHGLDFQFLPFGSGRRICPGRSLGMLIVEFVLASLVQCFDWKPCDCGDLTLREVLALVVKLQTPLLVNAQPRAPLHRTSPFEP